MRPARGSYDQVLTALAKTDRGSYGNLSYMPVFRSSALFFAVCGPQVTTKVSFLNYWREKNGNPDVGVLVTVRDGEGNKRAREYVKLAGMAYTFDVRTMLASDVDFTGSVEVEVFSSQDLKFQFPGLSVFYVTPAGASYVHSNQRVYNDAEDRARGMELNPWQTGFLIDAARYRPFVFLVNGPVRWDGGSVPVRVLNEAGGWLEGAFRLDALDAYAARRLDLAGVDGLAEHLGGRPGICSLNLQFPDVHMRFAAGNALPDGSWLSVTHSYFDATEHEDYFDPASLPAGAHAAFVPFNLHQGLDVELVLYPIYARSCLSLALEGYGADGHRWLRLELGDWTTPADGVRRISVREIVRASGRDALPGLYVLAVGGPQGRIPARITYGLNYSTEGRLGTNISASAYLAKTWGLGKRSWKWGPIVCQPGGRNLVMISAFDNPPGAGTRREGNIAIYGATGRLASRDFVLEGCAALTVEAEELLAAHGVTPAAEDILWHVVTCPDSTLDVNQVCISASGFVGGDHSF